MAWGAFYRPSDASFVGEHIANVYPSARLPPWSNRYPPSRPPSPPPPPPKKPIPQFRRPLAQTVFNDPAFSSDPRSHPHFDVADARSYKDLPPRPPRRSPSMYDPAAQENITWPAPAVLPHHPMTVDRRLSPLALSVSLEHEPILTSSGSSTVSSATSNSSSPTQTPGIYTTSPVSRTMPHSFRPTPYAKFPPSAPAQAPDENRPRMPYTMSTPDVRPPRPPPSPPRVSSAPDLPVTRKRSDKIKNFVRRLTKRDNLDRIDELDETDPFGLGFHHSGPYEAITNNLAKLGPLDSAADDLTGRMNPSKRKVGILDTPVLGQTLTNMKVNRASAPPPGRAAINDVRTVIYGLHFCSPASVTSSHLYQPISSQRQIIPQTRALPIMFKSKGFLFQNAVIMVLLQATSDLTTSGLKYSVISLLGHIPPITGTFRLNLLFGCTISGTPFLMYLV